MAVDVNRFSEALVYQTRTSCAQLLEDLHFLRGFDADKEKRETRAGTVGCGTVIAALAALFLASNLSTNDGVLPMLLGYGAVLLLGTAVFAFIRYARYKRLNLENRRYELVIRVMELLRTDISPSEPVAVMIDLREETHEDKFRGKGETRTGWKVKHYVDPWLSLQGRLLDGTHFHLEMTERIDMRSRWKRTVRGKHKHKTKRVSDALLRVRLRVKPERYHHLARLGPRAKGAVQLPQGARLKGLRVDEDRIDLAVLVDMPWSPSETPPPKAKDARARSEPSPPTLNGARVVAMAFLSLYQLLNLSRAIDKKAAHPVG